MRSGGFGELTRRRGENMRTGKRALRVRSPRRAGRSVKRRVHAEQRAFLWKNRRPVSGLLLVGIVTTILVAWIQRTEFSRGFMVGFFVALTFAGVWALFALHGFAHRGMGAAGEEWTSSALRKLPRKSWAVIDDVTFSDGNVDHVVIGPNAVYAIETKWSSGELESDRLLRASAQAERNAERIRRLLRSHKVDREVVPVLVLWGTAERPFEGERETRGATRVVAGSDLKDWRAWAVERSSGALDREALEALLLYMEGRLAYEAAGRRMRFR